MIKWFRGCEKSKKYTKWRYMFLLQCNVFLHGSPQLPVVCSSDLVSSFCYFPSHCFPSHLNKILKYIMQCNLSTPHFVRPVSLKFSKPSFFIMCPRNCIYLSFYFKYMHLFFLFLFSLKLCCCLKELSFCYSQHHSKETNLCCLKTLLQLWFNCRAFTAIKETQYCITVQHFCLYF